MSYEAIGLIPTQQALLRHARGFFLTDLVGLYSWDKDVRIDPPELREAIPPTVDRKVRRKMMEEREGAGKWLEKERIRFGDWEILIYSAQERGPLGEVTLRQHRGPMDIVEHVTGPLDPATWAKIGERIRSTHQRKAS